MGEKKYVEIELKSMLNIMGFCFLFKDIRIISETEKRMGGSIVLNQGFYKSVPCHH